MLFNGIFCMFAFFFIFLSIYLVFKNNSILAVFHYFSQFSLLLNRAFHIIWIAGQFWMLINRNFHLFKFFIILGWICHAFQFFSFIGKLSVIWKFEKNIYFFIFSDNCLCYSMGTFHFRIFPFFWSIFHMIQWKHFNICNFHWLWSIFQAILFYRNSCIFAISIFSLCNGNCFIFGVFYY